MERRSEEARTAIAGMAYRISFLMKTGKVVVPIKITCDLLIFRFKMGSQ
jgi:hypothetical protein